MKTNNAMSARVVSTCVTCVIALTLGGCGADGGDATTVSKEKVASETPAVDVKEPTKSIGGGDVGPNLDVPADFPEDVQLYPDMNITLTSPLPNGLTVNGHTADSKQDVASFFEDALPREGWVLSGKQSPTPRIQTMQYKKGARVAALTLTDRDEGTTIRVMTMTNEDE